jgi:4-diphosphocytidyl-2-C-methyl-D-erythritol kinase
MIAPGAFEYGTLGQRAGRCRRARPAEKGNFHGYDNFFPWTGFPSSPALPWMLIAQRADGLVVWAPAKVNLYLEVLGKRPDGYHDIASVLAAVSLYDTLVFKEENSGAVALRCDHAGLSIGPDNLVLRAARLLQARTGCLRGASIRLVKRIPMAAGLGGGSSDAAATLAGLNRLWQLGLADQELAALGAELGSDVPFFFATPAAWCSGRGEQVRPLRPGRTLLLVLLCPPRGLATAEVYRAVTVPNQPVSGAAMCQALEQGEVEEIGRLLHNRLQPAAERLCPAVAEGHARLAALGPAGQLMSGSGSALFALCRGPKEAGRVAAELRARQTEARVYLVRGCV